MDKYILDASFLVNVLTGEGGRKPTEFFEKISREAIYSLPLVSWEVANALRFKLPVQSEARELFARFKALPIKFLPLALEQMDEVLEMAYQVGGTVYDASYHFLARSLGGILITCDKKYFQKAKKLGAVELIS
ncbi:type II toxin-antitoxin system VapC family toxin [Candidatus Gottesmanbacteria bacterium]|nr:type II toxin-antitoxin system VapC family toxin [Candidatus Gottesmanbacteria bacterium]